MEASWKTGQKAERTRHRRELQVTEQLNITARHRDANVSLFIQREEYVTDEVG